MKGHSRRQCILLCSAISCFSLPLVSPAVAQPFFVNATEEATLHLPFEGARSVTFGDGDNDDRFWKGAARACQDVASCWAL